MRAVAAAVVVLLAAAGAAAQPSVELGQAARLARAGRHEEAAILLERVVEGDVPAPAEAIRAAQVQLAVELHALGLRQSALALAMEVGELPLPSVRRALIPLVAELVLELPRSSGASELAARFEDAEVAATPGLDANARARMRWVRGRWQYTQGMNAEAIATLMSIPADTRYHVQARMLAAAAHVRQREPGAAARILRGVIDHLGPAPASARRREAREVAIGALAGLFYERGAARGEDRSFATAAALWATVPRGSPRYAAAQLGMAWSAYRVGALDRAQAALDALPPGAAERDGEGAYLRVVVARERGRTAEMRAAVREHGEHAARSSRALDALLMAGGGTDSAAIATTVAAYASGAAPLPADLERPLRPMLDDAWVRWILADLRRLDGEERALAALSPAFRSSSVGARVLQDLSVARSLAADMLAEMLRVRADRWDEERGEEAEAMRQLEAETR